MTEPDVITREDYLKIRKREADQKHTRTLACIWAPVVLALIAGIIFMACYIVHEHQQRVTAWCYADPHRNSATSSFEGSADHVKGLCPDA